MNNGYKSIAYHGTTRLKAVSIIKQKSFTVSRDDEEWLGDGIYFFEGDIRQAQYWCTKSRHYKEWAVIKSIIEAQTVINLVDTDTYERFAASFGKFDGKYKTRKNKEPRKIINAVVLNALYDKMKYDVVRAIFPVTYMDRAKRSNILPMQIQLCIRHNDCIKTIEEVKVI